MSIKVVTCQGGPIPDGYDAVGVGGADQLALVVVLLYAIITDPFGVPYEHRHCSINFVTPHQKHAGLDLDILAKRKQTYERARARNPLRWIRNKTRNCNPVLITSLNPDDPRQTERILKKSA